MAICLGRLLFIYKNMRNLYYKCNNAYLGMASFEAIQEDTLYFLELPTNIFIGGKCALYENVKIDSCDLPIVRSPILGGAFVFEGGRNLWISLHTKEKTDEKVFTDMILNALKKVGIEAELHANDFVYQGKQLGMYTMAVKTDYGYFLSAQITFESDFDLIESVLIFPQTKWVDKPVENIREWLCPLSNFSVNIPTFLEAIKTDELNGKFTDS